MAARQFWHLYRTVLPVMQDMVCTKSECLSSLPLLLLGRQALRQTRSGFSNTFARPQYNCWRTREGQSGVEPRINNSSAPGYLQGVTNRPNTGPKSIGYSPARGVVMCWEVRPGTTAVTHNVHTGTDARQTPSLNKAPTFD